MEVDPSTRWREMVRILLRQITIFLDLLLSLLSVSKSCSVTLNGHSIWPAKKAQQFCASQENLESHEKKLSTESEKPRDDCCTRSPLKTRENPHSPVRAQLQVDWISLLLLPFVFFAHHENDIKTLSIQETRKGEAATSENFLSELLSCELAREKKSS